MRKGLATLLVAMVLAWCSPLTALQEPSGVPTFKSSTERVTLSATVKTRRGRIVTDLGRSDFELLVNGTPRPIEEFRTESTPVHVAMLVDFSGSMDVAARRQATRETAHHLLASLTPGTDQAGLFVFDKELRELQPLAPAPGNILAQLESIARPYGATSLFDAIAETGRTLAGSGGPRRAVVALTDGADNASRLTPEQVSGLASSIDVPVYIMIVLSPFDRSGKGTVDDDRLLESVLQGPLANLARWTGGEIFVGTSPSQSNQAARQIVSELRQQYLIAFEPGARVGWHPIELRTRDRDLVVRARSGYFVQGQRQGL